MMIFGTPINDLHEALLREIRGVDPKSGQAIRRKIRELEAKVAMLKRRCKAAERKLREAGIQ